MPGGREEDACLPRARALSAQSSNLHNRFRQAVEVGLIGREPIQAGVRPDGVIELQVFPDGSSGFGDRLVSMEIDLLVLDRLPDGHAR